MHPHGEISDLTLEQYALGELSRDAEVRVRAALQTDAALQARLAAIRDSDARILADYPAGRMAQAIRARLGSRVRSFPSRRVHGRAPLAWAIPMAAAVLLFVSFVAYREGVLPQLASSMTEITRMKGARPRLSVYRKTASGAEQLAAGQAARQRDVLQISYTAAGARYGVILSVDGRGTVTWHLPAGAAPAAAPALAPQGEVPLPSAYELDDAPGFERFIFVYSESVFDPRAVEQAVRALAARPDAAENAALALPKGLSQLSVALKKKQG
jgi:hypothetical protein